MIAYGTSKNRSLMVPLTKVNLNSILLMDMGRESLQMEEFMRENISMEDITE